jgi:hypothetical protein
VGEDAGAGCITVARAVAHELWRRSTKAATMAKMGVAFKLCWDLLHTLQYHYEEVKRET